MPQRKNHIKCGKEEKFSENQEIYRNLINIHLNKLISSVCNRQRKSKIDQVISIMRLILYLCAYKKNESEN